MTEAEYYAAVERAHERFTTAADAANEAMQPTAENGGIRGDRLDLDVVYQLAIIGDHSRTLAQFILNRDLDAARQAFAASFVIG